MSLPQPTYLGNQYVVTFNGIDVPSTAGFMAKDGWKRIPGFGKKSVVEDYAGNPVSRMGSGAQVKYQGTVYMPQGFIGANPTVLVPGSTFAMKTVVAGEASGTETKYRIVSAVVTGNREYVEVNLTVIKEASMTYA